MNQAAIAFQLFRNVREFISAEFSEADADRVISSSILSFKASRKKAICKTGYSCGTTCIARNRKCKSPLPEQAATYADYVALQSKFLTDMLSKTSKKSSKKS